MLVSLLPALIPFLVSEAEKIFGGASQGAAKKAWVMQALQELVKPQLDKYLPDWAKAVEPSIIQILDDLIEAAVAKLP